MRAVICGTGSAVPDKVLDNEELSQMVDTNDEWIRERTGIARRHIAKKDTCVSLAVKAAKSALEQAAIPAEDIDLLIVSTISSNVVLPCTACEVQKEIGAVHAAAYDLNAACTGFVLAYQSAQSFLQAGFYRTVLIIGSECLFQSGQLAGSWDLYLVRRRCRCSSTKSRIRERLSSGSTFRWEKRCSTEVQKSF